MGRIRQNKEILIMRSGYIGTRKANIQNNNEVLFPDPEMNQDKKQVDKSISAINDEKLMPTGIDNE